MKLNANDHATLAEIQQDATRSLQELADRLKLSQSTVWRKLQDFDSSGVVKKRVALVDPSAVGLKVCVIANITLTSHSEEATRAFQQLVDDRPEIMECYAISGAYDYMLKVRVRDVEAYENFLVRFLLRNPYVSSVASGFTLRELKYTTELPI